MRIALPALLLAILPLAPAKAAFTDFSDYSQTTSFASGQVFQSGDVVFKAVDFSPIPTSVVISADTYYNFFALHVGPGVEFQFPAGAQEASFAYEDGAGLKIAINGVQLPPGGQGGRPLHAGFSFLNGMSVGGVDVTTATTLSNRFSERGTVTFRGPLNSLVIAGLELSIDNVSVIVPEPDAASLAIIAAIAALARRRTRR